ncbi:hypothetical protein FRC03_002926 [Tulasnella sp. 419]|nr:hypothetical protein FRC03_002926 [Tulasnella sp. 419]
MKNLGTPVTLFPPSKKYLSLNETDNRTYQNLNPPEGRTGARRLTKVFAPPQFEALQPTPASLERDQRHLLEVERGQESPSRESCARPTSPPAIIEIITPGAPGGGGEDNGDDDGDPRRPRLPPTPPRNPHPPCGPNDPRSPPRNSPRPGRSGGGRPGGPGGPGGGDPDDDDDDGNNEDNYSWFGYDLGGNVVRYRTKRKEVKLDVPHFDMKLKTKAIQEWSGNTNVIVKWMESVTNLGERSPIVWKQLGELVPTQFKGKAKSWWQSLPLERCRLASTDWGTLRVEIGSYYMDRVWQDKQKLKAKNCTYHDSTCPREKPTDYFL